MIISIIVAVAQNNVIGKDNDLVWNLPDDMSFFKNKTKGHHVIMGRKNYYSIPDKWRPLPGRTNIVITRQPNLSIQGVTVVNSIREAIDIATKSEENEAFIIGGGEIFKQSIDIADKIYFTDVKAEFEGDTYFPDINMKTWKEVQRIPHPEDQKHSYAFDFVEFVRENGQ